MSLAAAAMPVEQVSTTNVQDLSWDNVEVLAPKLEAKPETIKEESQKPEAKVEVLEDTEEASDTEEVEDTKVEDKVEEPAKTNNTDLKDDTEVELKIDGKLEKVTLKDLKSNYSGKVAYDRKFSEVDKQHKTVIKEKAALQQEIEQVNSYVNTFAAKMKQKDAVGAMSYLAEFSGMSPAAMKQALITQLLPEINRQAGLTDAERDLELTKEDIAFQKTLQQRELAKLQQENSKKSLEIANTKLRMEKGISEQEWDEAFDFLDTHVDPGKPITRNDVADYAIWKRADMKASNVLTTYDSGKYLKDPTVRDTLTKIANENPDFSTKDLEDVLNEAFKGKIKEKVEQVAVEKKVQKPRDDKGRFTYTSQALTSWD